jgi:DNA-binding XRE family transcriptional regulator
MNAHETNRPMRAESLVAWRERLSLNKVQACARLGIARHTLDNYESGKNDIPLAIALACAAIAYGLPPMK